MSYLKMAPSTKRFFEGATFEVAGVDVLPALFGLRVEYDPNMPDGLVGIVGPERPFNPRETRWLDLRPKGK